MAEPNVEVIHHSNDFLDVNERAGSHVWWAVYAIPASELAHQGMRLAAVFYYEADARAFADPVTFANAYVTPFHLPLGHPMHVPYALSVPPPAGEPTATEAGRSEP